MAPKRPSPLDQPLAASSSEEASSEEAASGSGSEESESESEPKKTAESKPQPKKPESSSAAKPHDSSSGETETGSESESDADTLSQRKANASKLMEEVTPPPKTTKPRSKVSAGLKRAGGETEVTKDSKKAKKKGDGPEEKSKLFQRIWSDEDEIIILKGMNEYKTKKGVDAYADMSAFHDFIKKSLKIDVSKIQLQDKIRRMKKKFENNVKKKQKPTKAHDSNTFELSKKVWGGEDDADLAAVTIASFGKGEPPKSNNKTLETVKEAEKPGVSYSLKEVGLSECIVKHGLELIGGAKRAELEDRWSKLHLAELELFVQRAELMRDQASLIVEAFKKSDH